MTFLASLLRGGHDGAPPPKKRKKEEKKQLYLRGFMDLLANSVATASNVLLACDCLSSDSPFVTNAVLSVEL